MTGGFRGHVVRAGVIVVASSATWLAAYSAPVRAQSQQRTFSGQVDLTQLDVSVLDKKNQPVTGLTAADFTITEDGKPQPIQTFAEVDLPHPDPAGPAWTREISPDVITNTGVESERLIVIVLDPASVELWTVKSAKAIGQSIVDQLGPADLASVMIEEDRAHLQEFTHDRARLRSVIDQFQPGHEPIQAIVRIRAIWDIVDTLATVKARRKSVIWVTPGIIFDPSGEIRWAWKRMLDSARLANVNVYPIDPTGLVAISDVDDPTGIKRASVTKLNDFILATADNTGGHAFLNSNEFTSKIPQIFRETGSFYLLGYASPNIKADGGFHRIAVKVNRPGVTVHARAGYYAPEAFDAKHPPVPPSAAVEALAGLVPKRDLPMTIAATPLGIVSAKEQPVAITLGLTRPAAGEGVLNTNVVIDAFTYDGLKRQTVNVPLTLRPASVRDDVQEVLARIDLAPGRYQIRAGASSAGKAGSVYCDLTVPDVAKNPMTLSGVIVSAVRSPEAVPADALSTLLPVIPVVSRTFDRTDHVSALARIYEGGSQPIAPVSMTTRIVSDHDVVALNSSETIAAAQFDGAARVVEHKLDLPLATLPPGNYLLTFEAVLGKTTDRRDVRFTVR